jgi:hypothetical protein
MLQGRTALRGAWGMATAWDLETIGFQPIGQFGWVAHRDHVTAVDLIDFDGESLAGDSALKVEREHPIVAAS